MNWCKFWFNLCFFCKLFFFNVFFKLFVYFMCWEKICEWVYYLCKKLRLLGVIKIFFDWFVGVNNNFFLCVEFVYYYVNYLVICKKVIWLCFLCIYCEMCMWIVFCELICCLILSGWVRMKCFLFKMLKVFNFGEKIVIDWLIFDFGF